MKSSIKLDKRWKEIVFSASGFGPNLLMVLMMAYFTDAVNPNGLTADIGFWSYSGVPIISIAIFPILWTIGRFFDGIIDVPLAALTDSLKSKKGTRFITVLISFLPMLISFALCWIPVFGKGTDITTGQQIGNSIWIFFWSIIFFASYTLALITFYGSLSEVCFDQSQRARVSAYKSFFDTINYVLVYAAIPVIFKAINVPIWQVALYLSPLMLTILVPYFFRKGHNDSNELESKDESVGIGKSIAMTVKSRMFIRWLIVNCVAFFGLQMFLVAQNTLISGVMNLGVSYAAILNTCAFAPVPLMLYIFNRLRKKYGLRIVYQMCLIAFAIGILSFLFGSQYICGDNITSKLIIGGVGGVIGSFGIGAFFMVPYLVPTAIASVEQEVTKKNHSAMYFAVQALTTSIVGAIASSLIYEYVKNWVKPISSTFEWKCGVSLVPFIVAVFCIIGFFLCFLMPKRYDNKSIVEDVKYSAKRDVRYWNNKLKREERKYNRKIEEINSSSISLENKELLKSEALKSFEFKKAKYLFEISKKDYILEYEIPESKIKEENNNTIEKESYLANISLFILSGGLFGIISTFVNISKIKKLKFKVKKSLFILYILSLFVPFISIYVNAKLEDVLIDELKEKGIETKNRKVGCIISSIFLPLFFNVYNLVEKDRLFNLFIK